MFVERVRLQPEAQRQADFDARAHAVPLQLKTGPPAIPADFLRGIRRRSERKPALHTECKRLPENRDTTADNECKTPHN